MTFNKHNNALIKIVEKHEIDMAKKELKDDFLVEIEKEGVVLNDLAELINFLSETMNRKWDLNAILGTIGEVYNKVVWICVFESLLENNKKLTNVQYFNTLVECWNILEDKNTVPYTFFFKGQENCTLSNKTVFFRNIICELTSKVDLVNNIYLTNILQKDFFKGKQKKTFSYESPMNCKELFDSIKYNRELVELVKTKHPEYFVLYVFSSLGFNCIKNPTELNEYDKYLLHTSLTTSKTFFEETSNQFFINALFEKLNEKVLYFLEMMDLNLTKTLDLLLEHKKLNLILQHMEPAAFCYDIIVLCSRRDHLNLEFWVANNLTDVNRFIEYFYDKVIKENKERLFPFNKATINTIIKSLETRKDVEKEVKPEYRRMFMQIRALAYDGIQVADKATLFLSEIIQNNIKYDDVIKKLDFLLKEDTTLGKNIFVLLLENYDGLYKWANSDLIACFFGELIRRRLCPKLFLDSARNFIKKSILFQASDREFAFAFKVLEIFYNKDIDFYTDIESHENIMNGLVKKEHVILDEVFVKKGKFTKYLEILFENEIKIAVLEKIKEHMRKEVLTTNKIMYTSKSSSLTENTKVYQTFSENNIFYAICYYLESEFEMICEYVQLQDRSFKNVLFKSCFKLLFTLENNSFDDEEQYAIILGSFLGRNILAQNNAIVFDLFDVPNYILRNVEYRRISTSVGFVCSFLNECTKSKIYRPNNPWLMDLLDFLNELYFCTVFKVRKLIKQTFDLFGQLLKCPTTFKRIKGNLVSYDTSSIDLLTEVDIKTIKKVVTLAMDFTLREISSKTLNLAIETSIKIATNVYINSACVENTQQSFYKNFIVNLLRQCIKLTVFDFLKSALYTNILHFNKLAMFTFSDDVVFQLIADNVDSCLNLLEKVAITKLQDRLDLFETDSIFAGVESNPITSKIKRYQIMTENENYLRIKEQQINFINEVLMFLPFKFVDKKSLRKIENAEYQDIKSFLLLLGNRVPFEKQDFIFDSFSSLLGEKKYNNFEKVVMFLNTKSSNKDEDCLNLSKYLVGYALKTDCKEDFIFDFLYKIFMISKKTQKETVNWLIYSDGESRSVSLISKFIEYNFIFAEEYDQALANLVKNSQSNIHLEFALCLLENLILSQSVFCSIYNFIHTIEAISKKSEFDTASYAFLKKIENKILDFDVDGNDKVFDDFVSNLGFLQTTENICEKFISFSNGKELNFDAAFKSCWTHFVIYNGSFRFFKVNILVHLLQKNGLEFILRGLELLVQAYEKKMFLFYEFYCKFFTLWLDLDVKKKTFKAAILKIIDVLSPSNFPSFSSYYIEVTSSPYFDDFLDNENIEIIKEIMNLLQVNEKYEKLVYDFLCKKECFVCKFRKELYGMCPDYCVSLKNYLDKNGEEFLHIPDDYGDKLVFIKKVVVRYHAKNATEAVSFAYEKLKKTDEQTIVNLENAYFNVH